MDTEGALARWGCVPLSTLPLLSSLQLVEC